MVNMEERNIFIVDDEPKVLDVLREALEEPNIKIRCFQYPTECLAAFSYSSCDLLIADLKMPEMDGLELVTKFKFLNPLGDVLIITGYADIPTTIKAMKCGVVDVIEKPFDKKNIVRKVKSALERSNLAKISLARLTRTEKKVFAFIIAGKSNKEIGKLFNRAERTIEVHRKNIMNKFGFHRVAQLVRLAIEIKMIDYRAKEEPFKTKKKPENDND